MLSSGQSKTQRFTMRFAGQDRIQNMKSCRSTFLFLFFLFCATSVFGSEVRIKAARDLLIQDEDTDGDQRITIEDPHVKGTERGDKRFWMETVDGRKVEVSGTYYLSNLLQELTLAAEAGKETMEIPADRIFEPPVDHISRSIRQIYWDGLTRRLDEGGLSKSLTDEKTTTVDGFHHLYVPHSDPAAFKYYSEIAKNPELKMKVDVLPDKITASYVRGLDGYHGVLSLAIGSRDGVLQPLPFVVPGGRFNEMYGWDSYFITLGLLQDGRIDLAKAMVENFVYEITHYGQILNANRTYYLTRSQPPFLTSMALAVYESLPKNDESKEWLKNALLAAVREYNQVWMNRQRLTSIGLSRYYDSGYGPSPEVEAGHFDVTYAKYASAAGRDVKAFEEAYKAGRLKVPELDRYFVHDRCMRESGHDTSYRLIDRCADLVTVDLNSLLFKIETDLAETIISQFGGTLSGESAAVWQSRANKRKELMNRYLWNADKGMYFDYDFVNGKQIDYVSAATLYPLWGGQASRAQAESLVAKALPQLEMPGGIVSSTEASRGPVTADHPQRQWDYPNGWSPHQVLTWIGLNNYGYQKDANRLIYRWLYTITSNASQYNGTVPEKYDVVRRTHQVFAEYGNVGTNFAYITREGFGWTNGSYKIGLALLPQNLRDQLNRMIPPEWIFP